ncbi:MAG: 30S ribosomal protein S6 [Candidatus Omnitrophota bacterium]|nr:30S ribosomal protein S6 [Candidatus Omnitrophota bacterium]
MEKARGYLGLFIITPEKQEQMDEVKGSIKGIIGENSGKILKENEIGKKRLAYPVKKKEEGIYYEVNFDATPESITKMSRLFRINNDILRTLIDKA